MKIGVAEIAIAGGLAWLLFGRGGKVAQGVVERPAPAPQPSPAYETPGITPPVIPAPPVQVVVPETLPIVLPGATIEFTYNSPVQNVERLGVFRFSITRRNVGSKTVQPRINYSLEKSGQRRIGTGGPTTMDPNASASDGYSFDISDWWGGFYDLRAVATDDNYGVIGGTLFPQVLYVPPGVEGLTVIAPAPLGAAPWPPPGSVAGPFTPGWLPFQNRWMTREEAVANGLISA